MFPCVFTEEPAGAWAPWLQQMTTTISIICTYLYKNKVFSLKKKKLCCIFHCTVHQNQTKTLKGDASCTVFPVFLSFRKKSFTTVCSHWTDWLTSWLCARVTRLDFCGEWDYRGFGGDIGFEIFDARSRKWTVRAHTGLPRQRYALSCHLYGVHPLRCRGRSLHTVEAVMSRQMGGIGWVGVVFFQDRGSWSRWCWSFPQPVDWWVDLQTFPHLWDGWWDGEWSLSLGYTRWQNTIWIYHCKVTGALYCLVLQRGPLVIHDTMDHAEVTVVRLLYVLVLVGLLQVRLELVLMLWQRQYDDTGDMPRWGSQGQVCRDDRRAHGRHVLCAGVDEVLVSLPLPAASTGLPTWLHGGWFRGRQSSEVQVVLVCFYQHLPIGRQPPVVHQRSEDRLRTTVFGLCLKQARQLGHTVHGAAAGVEVVGVLFFAACQVYVSPPVVTHTVDNDARENGAHGEG